MYCREERTVAVVVGSDAPCTGAVAAEVNIVSGDTGLVDDLYELLALLRGALVRHLVVHRDAQDYREALADIAAYLLDDLADDACTVFNRAAVFIGAVVPALGDELIEHVAGMRVYLDRVEARALSRSRGLAERGDEVMYLLSAHGDGVLLGLEVQRHFACGQCLDERGHDGVLPRSRAELDAGPDAMALDAAVVVCPLFFLIRSTGGLVVGGHRVDLIDSLALRHYHGDAALGALLNEADHRVRHVEAEVIAGGHRRHDEAVLQRDIAKLNLFKQFCISAIHRITPERLKLSESCSGDGTHRRRRPAPEASLRRRQSRRWPDR